MSFYARAGEKPVAVSIVTISKDDPGGLRSTIDSVQAQALVDYELIVVRSGTSQSLDLRTYDPRLVIVDEPAHGISRAFNSGVARARGEWIQFLNGGDAFMDANALRDLVAAQHDDVEMVLSFAQVQGRGFTIPRRALCHGRDGFLYASHQGSLFRRRLFERYGMFSPEFRVRMDLEWLARLPPDTRYVFLDRRTVGFDTSGVSGNDVVRSSLEETRILWRQRRNRARALYVAAVLLPFRMVRQVWRTIS